MNVLVIAAHPDDEVLGCGATVAAHATAGHRVESMIMAQGVTSRGGGADHVECLGALRRAAARANEILGVTELTLLDHPDNAMDSVALLDVVKQVELRIARLQPDIVYTHHAGDLNIDHRIVHDAVVTACRPVPGRKSATLLFFEVASSTEWQAPGVAPAFVPNWYVDISSTLDAKLAALDAYSAEMRPWPHARSIAAVEHLARWRGANVGVDAAEAYILGRHLRVSGP